MDLDKLILTLYRNPKSAVVEHEFNLQLSVNGKQETITFKNSNEIIRKIALFTFGKNYEDYLLSTILESEYVTEDKLMIYADAILEKLEQKKNSAENQEVSDDR